MLAVNWNEAFREPIRDASFRERVGAQGARRGWGYDDAMEQLGRITMDPAVMGGNPCIGGLRVTVGMIVEALASGRTEAQVLEDFPYLEEADIRAALAARLVS